MPQTTLPKRLIALLLMLTIAAAAGLFVQQGILFCALILLMVIAILGRQRAGLYLLRGYTIAQLGIVSLLPMNLFTSDDVTTLSEVIHLSSLPSYLLLAGLILLAIVQVWLAFNGKVSTYCHIKNNMNIMR